MASAKQAKTAPSDADARPEQIDASSTWDLLGQDMQLAVCSSVQSIEDQASLILADPRIGSAALRMLPAYQDHVVRIAIQLQLVADGTPRSRDVAYVRPSPSRPAVERYLSMSTATYTGMRWIASRSLRRPHNVKVFEEEGTFSVFMGGCQIRRQKPCGEIQLFEPDKPHKKVATAYAPCHKDHGMLRRRFKINGNEVCTREYEKHHAEHGKLMSFVKGKLDTVRFSKPHPKAGIIYFYSGSVHPCRKEYAADHKDFGEVIHFTDGRRTRIELPDGTIHVLDHKQRHTRTEFKAGHACHGQVRILDAAGTVQYTQMM